MHQLKALLAERISSGLKRRGVTSCSRWAETYRVMGQLFPGLLNHEHHPWTKEMRDCDSEMMVGQKGAQLGFTEVALDKSFYAIDINGISVMYILPASNPDASDFSTARFDPALEQSPHLRNLFSDVKNIGHKRAGNANLYLRGSRSRSQLKSVPVGLIVLDEIDEFKAENIPLIFERLSGQTSKQSFLLSTPTIPLVGINAYFEESTQDHFFFVCPHCGRLTELLFPDCLIVTGESWTDPKVKGSYIRCKECHVTLDHKTKREWLSLTSSKPARWVSARTDRTIRGFHVSQLYSPTTRPDELAVAWLKAKTNPTDEQEFYNSKLGLTHIVEGARITDTQIIECTKSHRKQLAGTGLITLGIDVGKWLHYEATQWFLNDDTSGSDINLRAHAKVILEGKCLDFEDLDLIMQAFNIVYCVIDANPEKRKAFEFASRFMGRVRLCYYAVGVHSKQIHVHSDEELTVSVDRTAWLDVSLSRFHKGSISLPMDVSHEYKENLKALVRIYKKDADGNPVGRYEKGNKDDHFAHARNYSEIALAMAISNAQSQDLVGVV
jgi:hypothetical protein